MTSYSRVVTKSGLEELNDDVWELILEQIYLCDYNTIHTLSRVSKRLHWVSSPWQHKKVAININSPRQVAFLYRLLEKDCSIASHIRDIEFRHSYMHYSCGNPSFQELRRLVLKLISRVSRLHSLSWYGFVNKPLLEGVVNRWPNVRLIVEGNECYVRKGPLPFFVTCGRLHTLIIRVSTRYSDYIEVKDQLQKLFLQSPNLKVFHFYDFESISDIIPHMSAPFCYNEPELFKDFPKLEELSLQGYVQSFISREELKTWGSRGGWTDLKVLRLHPEHLLSAFVGHVPSLKVLEIPELEREPGGTIQYHCTPIGPLKELTIEGPRLRFPCIDMSRVPKTVTHLTLHNTDGFLHHRDHRDNSDFKASDLQVISEACPNLTFLAINMWREGEWPYNFLAALGELQKLDDLSLLVEYSTRIGGKPTVDADACRHLFQYVQEHKIGTELRRLVLQETPEATYKYSTYLNRRIPNPTHIRDLICKKGIQDELVVQEKDFLYMELRYENFYTNVELTTEDYYRHSRPPFKNFYELLKWMKTTHQSGHARYDRKVVLKP